MLPWGKQGDGAKESLQRPWGHAPIREPLPTSMPGSSSRGLREGAGAKAGLWLAQRGSACLHCKWLLAAILSSQLRAGPRGEQVVSWA